LIWVVLQKECQQKYGPAVPKIDRKADHLNNTTQFCANRPNTVTGVCHGDSGG